MATIWPLFRWILTLFSVFIAFLCDNFCKKFQIGKEIFQIFFEKNFQSANLKILRWKLLEKFVFCHKILWMLNWKVKFGQNGPKINPKGPEMSIFLPKAKYGHICHENCGHISKNFMAKAIWNMATLAIYGHSWEHCLFCFDEFSNNSGIKKVAKKFRIFAKIEKLNYKYLLCPPVPFNRNLSIETSFNKDQFWYKAPYLLKLTNRDIMHSNLLNNPLKRTFGGRHLNCKILLNDWTK